MQVIHILIGLVIFGILLIIVLPIFILSLPFLLILNYEHERKYKQFLKEQEGKQFFCYNNRKKNVHFIQKEVLPKLPDQVTILYLEGKNLVPEPETEFFSYMIANIKNKVGFPYLLKIENGQLIDKSVNNTCFNVIAKTKELDFLLAEINAFYNKDESRKNV